MSTTLYLPIHSMNLAHYLSGGIIAPSIYIENKNIDIQDRFNNYLLLSSYKFTNETNCAIEIILTPQEESAKKISENFYLFDIPLPISRIKNIYFSNEEQKITTNFDITSGAAFIPENLLKVSKDEHIDTKELIEIQFKPSEKDWSAYLKKYDHILGGFAIMKISKENYQNYPTHYFTTLGNINQLFTNTLEKQKISFENSFQFAINNDGKFKDFRNTIYSDIDYNEVQRYAEKDKIKLEVKNGLIQINNISQNTQTYSVAILERYGKGKRMQVDSFISDLISNKFFNNEKSQEINKKNEGLSLIFGINKGYKAFRNKYKTPSFEADIKFKLDSKLDYYIIESIYQNVFNSLNNISTFEYIDEWVIEYEDDKRNIANFETYQVIDKTIILKKKEVSSQVSSSSYLEKRSKIFKTIAQRFISWFPFQIKAEEIESLFKTELNDSINKFEEEIKNSTKQAFTGNIENIIKKLNETIKEKDDTIFSLNKQIRDLYQLPQHDIAPINLVKEHLGKTEIELEFKTPDTLYLDDQNFSKNPVRKKKLDTYTLTDLKKLAKELNIPKYSSFKKADLIVEIVKYETK